MGDKMFFSDTVISVNCAIDNELVRLSSVNGKGNFDKDIKQLEDFKQEILKIVSRKGFILVK